MCQIDRTKSSVLVAKEGFAVDEINIFIPVFERVFVGFADNVATTCRIVNSIEIRTGKE